MDIWILLVPGIKMKRIVFPYVQYKYSYIKAYDDIKMIEPTSTLTDAVHS